MTELVDNPALLLMMSAVLLLLLMLRVMAVLRARVLLTVLRWYLLTVLTLASHRGVMRRRSRLRLNRDLRRPRLGASSKLTSTRSCVFARLIQA